MARSPLGGRVHLALAPEGECDLPFADATFDALTFTYLLRYVADPGATMKELVRVVKPGGVVANLEFHTPTGLRLAPAVGALHAGRFAGGRVSARRA